jgi:hypothetical protein
MTAEEFWHSVSVQSTLDMYGNYSQWDIESAMIGFAKLKVKEALEAAAENVEINDYDEHEQYSPHADRDSILNAYNINDIK